MHLNPSFIFYLGSCVLDLVSWILDLVSKKASPARR